MKKYQSEVLMVIHQDAEGMHRLGIISDEKMKEFDRGCLVQEKERSNKSKPSFSEVEISNPQLV
jgi:DNA-binding transcriptional regulator YiaG